MKFYTADEIKAEITDDERTRWRASFEASRDISAPMKKLPRIADMWMAGCWLDARLEGAGESEESRSSLCFAHGQRCVYGEPFQMAADAWMKFVEGKPERGGPELAIKLATQNPNPFARARR